MAEWDGPGAGGMPSPAEQRWLPATWATRWGCQATVVDLAGVDAAVMLAEPGGDLLGWSAGELAAVPAGELLHPDDRDRLSGIVVRAAAAGGGLVVERLRVLARDRRYWWTGWQLWSDRSRSGVAVTGVEYLAPTGEWGPPVGWWCWDVDADVVSWTTELLDMFALRVGPPTSYRAFLDVVSDDDRDDVARAIDVAVAVGDPYVVTFRCPTRHGRDRWFHASGRHLPVTADQPRRVGGIVKYLNPPPDAGRVAVIGCG